MSSRTLVVVLGLSIVQSGCDEAATMMSVPSAPAAVDDGYDAPPLSGPVFALERFAVANPQLGCPQACFGNRLTRLLEAGLDYEQLCKPLLGDHLGVLIELAGLPAVIDTATTTLVTLKVYAATGNAKPYCSDPLDARTFSSPVVVDASSLHAGQAKARIRSRIEDGRFVPMSTTMLALGKIPTSTRPLEIEQVRIYADLSEHLSRDGVVRIRGGVISGVVSVNTTASARSVLYDADGRPSLVSWLDLLATRAFLQPDIDVDGDGLECVAEANLDEGVSRCCDGNGSDRCMNVENACLAAEIPADDPRVPWTCAVSEKMADAYSVALVFSAVPIADVRLPE
jgi:hypothetical protein